MSAEDRGSKETVPDYGSAPPQALPPEFAPGTVIGNVWTVEKKLGKGGMGSVFRCHNKHATRILAAIKLLDPAFMFHPEAKARFLREAEILYTVDHPNVVKVSNVHLDARPPYLEMEFVDGLSLEDELARKGQVPTDIAVDRAKQLGRALRYLHRKGIYHRDVKPQNILTRVDGTLKLVDFGLAVEKGGDRITHQDNSNFGTVSYCPPEWGQHGELDPAVWDLYALGVVLYEMLTGTVAFPVAVSGEPRVQMIQVMSDKQRIEALDPGPRFQPGLREIVRRLTHKDPSKRIPNAKELLDELDTLVPDWQFDPEDLIGPSRSSGGRGLLRTLGFLGMVIALGLATGVFIAALLLLVLGMGGGTRDVEILVAGVSIDEPVRVRIADQPPSEVEGTRQRFLRLPVGQVSAVWSVGEGCDAPCGPDCPAWCVTGETPLTIARGDGVQILGLELRAPRARKVRVVAEGVNSGFVRMDGKEVGFIDGVATIAGVRPGPHAIFAAAGDCPPGCEGSTCGDGCAVTSRAVVVPAREVFEPVVLDLQAPAEPEVPLHVGPVPTSAGVRVPRQVTRGQFAQWLASHPEWQADTAVAAGRADGAYLKNWEGLEPPKPVGSAVTHIPWPAAAAFCATRGGLVVAEAAPATWTTGPPIEWRRGASGGRAWRRMDGQISTRVSPTESNSSTSFRCAR